jgi:hypothetical protein
MKLHLPWAAPVAARLLLAPARLYCRSLRLEVEDAAAWERHLENGGRVLLTIWHQQILPTIGYFARYRAYRPSLMISRSRDGDLAAAAAASAGWHAVRGSSSRGGSAALMAMVRALRAHRLAGHIADGPRGPLGRVKPGVIHLARLAGALVVPVTFHARHAWHLPSWDRFMLPWPASRMRLRFGAPLDPTGVGRQSLEAIRRELEATMRRDLWLPPGERLP